MLPFSKFQKKIHLLCISLLSSTLIGCSWKSFVPNELRSPGSIKLIYEVDGTHWVGPRGINEAFVVFDTPEETARIIQKEGIEYLSRLTGDERAMYKDWRTTPIQSNEERWNRKRNDAFNALVNRGLSTKKRWSNYRTHQHYAKCHDTSLCSFYGDYISVPRSFKNDKTLKDRTLNDLNFVDDIDLEYRELANSILNTPNNYFGYGEFGVLIIAPKHRKIILLFRD